MPALKDMTDEELGQHAFGVLRRELGLAGYVRFVRLYLSGRGDYTAERHQWLDQVDQEELVRDVLKLQAEQPR